MSQKLKLLVTSDAQNRLELLHVMYKEKEGNYLEQSTRFTLSEWSKKYSYKRRKNEEMDVLGSNNKALVSLNSERISRQQVFSIFEAIPTEEFNIVEAFVAAMAWGFKPDSYGAYRTSVMLSRPRRSHVVSDVLQSVAEISDPNEGISVIVGFFGGSRSSFWDKVFVFHIDSRKSSSDS